MTTAVLAFADEAGPAAALAARLGAKFMEVELHRFPDGESLVRVPSPVPETAILYRSLHDPNARLVEILLAASALRENGAGKVIIVAPYLAYMRQDMAFRPGEAVSQRVIGKLLASAFDGCVTVDPHLHRISSLSEVMPGTVAASLSAAPALAEALDLGSNPLLAGPDEESHQWVEAIAAPHGLDFIIGRKVRNGDRDVHVEFVDAVRAAGRNVVLVDDVISSGATLIEAAQCLRAAGALRIEVLATHCLARPADLEAMRAGGIEQVRSTDSVPGPTARIALAELLARGLAEAGLIT